MSGRKLLTSSKDVIAQVALAADYEGVPTQCEQLDLVSYDVSWANGAGNNVSIAIQKSNDGNTWKDLYSSSPILLAGASGDHQIDVRVPNCKFLRPKITVVAGVLDVTVSVKGTTIGA